MVGLEVVDEKLLCKVVLAFVFFEHIRIAHA